MPPGARGSPRRDAMGRGLPPRLACTARQIRELCRTERGRSPMSLDVKVARLIDATPEETFDAFTDPEGQAAFYGQDDPGWIVRSQCDLRVGGVWTVDFGPSPRELYRHRHVFEAIERPKRLLLTCTETRLDGTTIHIRIEFTFEAKGKKTL